MATTYTRVNDDDHDDVTSVISNGVAQPRANEHRRNGPDSPPPSFRSRASSTASRSVGTILHDATLADAFGTEADTSDDDEDDDRQRLVRTNRPPPTTPSGGQTHARSATQITQQVHSAGTVASAAQVVQASGHVPSSLRIVGGGMQSDGVFSNLSAKPERSGAEKNEQPPTYEQAAADAAPPYWETTILAPGLGGPDEVFIDGMPVGSIFSFAWNGMITISFSLVGFLLTYLLHSTHAAKNGSRAGLGIILIQYGFYMKGSADGSGGGGIDPSGNPVDGQGGFATPTDPNAHDFDPSSVVNGGGGNAGAFVDAEGSDWIAYLLMIIGWFILIRSLSDYLKARRHEQLVLQSPDRGLPVPIIADDESPELVV